MIGFWSTRGDDVTNVALKFAGSSSWGRIDFTMPALPLAAVKNLGVVPGWKKFGELPDWTLAPSGRFTMSDPVDETIIDRNRWDLLQAPNGQHLLVNSVEQALGAGIDKWAQILDCSKEEVEVALDRLLHSKIFDLPASKLGAVSGTVSDALQALSLDGGDRSAGDTAASTAMAATVTVADGAPSFTAVTGSVAEPISNVATVISDGATLELASAYSGTISFAGATGTLIIDNSSSFSGTIAGQLTKGNVIDLADITAGANAIISYSGNNSPGTLTVSDGTHTANIALEGDYSLANFTAYSDGQGGTSVIDPPTYVGTGLDANGWTTFTPSADTRIIYVSSSAGSDSNSGLSQSSPVATIDRALSLVRDGSADWVLLKAGDTWVNQEFGYIDFSGRSATEPILISSYGAGDRPQLLVGNNGSGAAIGSFNTTLNNVAIVGLEFYAYTRDPSNPSFAGGGPEQMGLRILSPADNFLIEDCKFSFFSDNTIEGSNSGDVVLRRNIISDNWDTDGRCQGLYIDHVANPVFEENIFDHNGWNESIAGAEATIFSQGLYVQYNCGPVIATGNIFTDAAATGAQFRSGGIITNNLFVDNPVGFQVGSSPSTQPPPIPPATATVTGNVVLEGDDINGSARGFGFVLYANTGLVTFQNNIIAHEDSNGNNLQSVFIDQGANNDILTNNIIYDWGGPSKFYNFGSGNTTSPNFFDQAGYLDPNRSVETYMASLGESATLDAFLAAAEGQSRSGWNPQYTANAVNSYIEAGFNIGSPPPPVAGSVAIGDVTINEGNSGTKVATFTVTRSGGTEAFDVNFATSNGTATVADGDYVATSGTLHFGANQNTQTVSVTINGDTKVEANEAFNVVLSNATNGATISDGQGIGTITNDDSAAIAGSVSINDVTISEGNSGTKVATFTVTRSGGTAAFDVNSATSDGTATVADSDYVAASNTLHFGANQNTQTISVTINGDTKVEANEAFNVVLSNATNGATISDGQGIGTITNDDGAALLGDDNANTLTGTSGNDTMQGLGGNDTMQGLGGNDMLIGGAGNDTMIGGTGNDIYWLNQSGDIIVENAGEGTDAINVFVSGYTLADNVEDGWLVAAGGGTLTGNGLANMLNGSAGNDMLDGNSGNDALIGGAGNDMLLGGAGNDTMTGDIGNDIYWLNQSGDIIVENAGEGTDAINVFVSGYTLADNVEDGWLVAAGGGTLTGNGLANVLNGASGADVLNGAGGSDTLVGNGGNDTFVFVSGQANSDVIVDFAGNGAAAGDSLQFVGFGTLAQGASFTQVGTTNQWQIHSGLNGHNEVITLQNSALVNSSDFLFL
jgi:Ca2+-binding RTX toxin-like protein